MPTTIEELAKILREQREYPTKEINGTTRLSEDLGLDSLEGCDFTYAVEKHFGVKIPEEIAFEFKTVGDYANYLNSQKK